MPPVIGLAIATVAIGAEAAALASPLVLTIVGTAVLTGASEGVQLMREPPAAAPEPERPA